MRKTVLFACVIVLVASTSVFAASFWGGFLSNFSFRSGSISTGPSVNSGSTPGGNASGVQYATTSGVTGSGGVIQGQGAAGYQDSDADSQEQGLAAGQGQVVYLAFDEMWRLRRLHG